MPEDLKQPSLIFEECIFMHSIDLGSNRLTGILPSKMPEDLIILRLRSNFFSGDIHNLCSQYKLLVLDLGDNRFSGTIPQCLKEMFFLVQGYHNVSDYVSYFKQFMLKSEGRQLTYSTTVHFVNTVDLSSNNFEGKIPEEVSSLIGLSTLNLSRNHLTRNIPSNIGNLRWLETLDLDAPGARTKEEGDEDEDDKGKLGVYGSSVLGFVIGFWGACGTLVVKSSWRYAYFQFFDNLKDKVALEIALAVAHWHQRRS